MLTKTGENRQKYRKTIKNFKTGKKQTKISKNRQKCQKKTKKQTKISKNRQKW